MITKKRFAPILILNVGSSSIKYATFDEKLKELDRNSVTDISKLPQILDSKFDIPSIIGHRIVHGGQKYVQPTKLTPEVMADLQEVSKLAPLHNPPALKVAQQIIKKWPAVENWAVFDTAFFANLPIYAKLYALPFELSEKYQIIRYGFHGISHRWVAQQAAKKLNQDLAKLKVITVHLGAGCSIAAIEDGQPIDTSMGFTPLEGLVMATRCGDIDPAVVGFLQREAEMSWDQIEKMLNEESGLLGLSGVAGDIREVVTKAQLAKGEKEADEATRRAGLALQIYAYRVKKYIGAYWAALGGLDALVFTGAVGESSEFIREMITHGLTNLGKFEILVIPTNEELQMAREITQTQ